MQNISRPPLRLFRAEFERERALGRTKAQRPFAYRDVAHRRERNREFHVTGNPNERRLEVDLHANPVSPDPSVTRYFTSHVSSPLYPSNCLQRSRSVNSAPSPISAITSATARSRSSKPNACPA